MDIVVDASVLIAVVANEPEKEALIRLTEGEDLIAPHSVHWEIGNALSAMLKRKRITLEQARLAIQEYKKIPLKFVEIQLDEAVEIADEFGIYAYDACLIQCALEHESSLITLDESLITHARRKGIQVLEVVQ